MPRGMIQALLGTTPTNLDWSPADLSECIFRNAEATDKEEDLLQKLSNLGNLGDSKHNAPTEEILETRTRHIHIFP